MRLIDADKLSLYLQVFTDIKNEPTVDAVPVVRCEKCIYHNPKNYICSVWGKVSMDDDFCKRGVSK